MQACTLSTCGFPHVSNPKRNPISHGVAAICIIQTNTTWSIWNMKNQKQFQFNFLEIYHQLSILMSWDYCCFSLPARFLFRDGRVGSGGSAAPSFLGARRLVLDLALALAFVPGLQPRGGFPGASFFVFLSSLISDLNQSRYGGREWDSKLFNSYKWESSTIE